MLKYFSSFLVLVFLSSCYNSSVEYAEKVSNSVNLEEIRQNDSDGFISYFNTFYGFTFQLPQNFKPVFSDTKKGGYNFQEEEKEFLLSTHGFSPFVISNLKASAHTLWKELVPKGFKFQKEGSIPMEGYQNYVVEGLVKDGKKYQFIVILLDKNRSRNFVIVLQTPSDTSSKAIGLEILKSIQRIEV